MQLTLPSNDASYGSYRQFPNVDAGYTYADELIASKC